MQVLSAAGTLASTAIPLPPVAAVSPGAPGATPEALPAVVVDLSADAQKMAASTPAAIPTDMLGNPLPPERIGIPGRHPLSPEYSINADYENNLSRFRDIASIVLDTDGVYSDDEKLTAWKGWHSMFVGAQLKGFGPEDMKLSNDIAASATTQRIEAARMALSNVQLRAMREAEAAGGDVDQAIARATLTHLGGLSEADQELAFTNVNLPDATRGARYADKDAWRRELERSGLFAPIERTAEDATHGARYADKDAWRRELEMWSGLFAPIERTAEDATRGARYADKDAWRRELEMWSGLFAPIERAADEADTRSIRPVSGGLTDMGLGDAAAPAGTRADLRA